MGNSLYISSTVRNTKDPICHGSIRKVDWSSKSVVSSVDRVFPYQFCIRNPNPRGGVRGWNGLCIDGPYIVVANHDALVFYDENLSCVHKVLTHPSVSSIHGVYFGPNGIYVASTANDLYALVDGHYNFHLHPILQDKSLVGKISPWLDLRGRTPGVFDPHRDYRLEWGKDIVHLNYVRQLRSGKVVALFNALNMLLEIHPTFRVLWAPDLNWGGWEPTDGSEYLSCPHDIVEAPNGNVLICSSATGVVYEFDFSSGNLIPIWRGPLEKYGWIRGLDCVGESIFVGTGVGKALEVSRKSGEVLESADVFEPWEGQPHAVFGLAHQAGSNRS